MRIDYIALAEDVRLVPARDARLRIVVVRLPGHRIDKLLNRPGGQLLGTSTGKDFPQMRFNKHCGPLQTLALFVQVGLRQQFCKTIATRDSTAHGLHQRCVVRNFSVTLAVECFGHAPQELCAQLSAVLFRVVAPYQVFAAHFQKLGVFSTVLAVGGHFGIPLLRQDLHKSVELGKVELVVQLGFGLREQRANRGAFDAPLVDDVRVVAQPGQRRVRDAYLRPIHV